MRFCWPTVMSKTRTTSWRWSTMTLCSKQSWLPVTVQQINGAARKSITPRNVDPTEYYNSPPFFIHQRQRTRSKSVINPPDERALGGLLLLSSSDHHSSAAAAATTNKQPTQQQHRQHRQSAASASQTQSTYPLRRQSAVTDIKAKVSKWTKVKAAFKWERANPSLNENGKSTDSGIGLISPLNTEVIRYLRVPTMPIACAGSSADSVLSSSSGHLQGGNGNGGGSSNPATPGTMSSASSIDDVRTASEDFREFTGGRLFFLCLFL